MPPEDRAADPHAAARARIAAAPAVVLGHIAELSRNAAATWFGLLGLLAFVGITLLGHRDVDFFARGAGTQLPLVNITVPVEAFFYAAPALVAAVYAYFHLYLMSLWDALADAPPRIDGRPLADRVYPWLVSYAALWYRDRRRGDGSSAPRALGRVVVATAFLFGWLFGIVVLAFLWWRSMPAHDEWLTLWAGACLCFAALIGLTGFASAAKRMAGSTRDETAKNHGVRWHWATASVALVAFLSWETTEGTLMPLQRILTWTATGEPVNLLVSADLREAELTPRPPDWKPFELWLRDLRREQGTGDPNQNPLIPTAEEVERYRLMIAALDAPALEGADLVAGKLSGAFLPGADLRGVNARRATLERAQVAGARLDCPPSAVDRGNGGGCAQMEGADLRDAQMQGANLRNAHMQNAYLGGASMQGANLQGAHMQGANFEQARMHGAFLAEARLRDAFFGWAEMQGAFLGWADLRGADFSNAQIQGAYFRGAMAEGAYLGWTKMQGVYLRDAKMQGVDLSSAQMQGADLRQAQMRGADCTQAVFLAALLHAADLACIDGTLVQAQLDFTVGDADTLLPKGLHLWSCLDRGDLPRDFAAEIDSALGYHPETTYDGDRVTRAEFEDALFCDPGEVPRKVGRHPKPAATE